MKSATQIKVAATPVTPAIPTGRMMVTPTLARTLLERNISNRPLSRREVERLKRVLETDRWLYNGDTLKFDKLGWLKDGQHRLTAVAESGIAAEMIVVADLESDAFATLDQGRRRSGGDVLFMKGVKHHNAASAACSTFYRIMKNRPMFGSSDPLPAYGALEIVGRHPGLIQALEYCVAPHKHGDAGIIALGPLAALHYVMGSMFNQAEKAVSFTEGITAGTGLAEDSPILQFRRRVLQTGRRRDVMHAQAKTALLAKVAGFHLSGATVKYLTQPPTAATYQTLIPGLQAVVEAQTPKSRFDDLTY